MKRTSFGLVAVIAIVIGSSLVTGAQAMMTTTFSDDFSVANSLADNFIISGTNFSQSSTVGVGDTGGLIAPANSGNLYRGLPAFDLSEPGTTLETSFDFLWDATGLSGNSQTVALTGFVVDVGFTPGGGSFSTAVRFRPGNNTWEWKVFNGTTVNGADNNTTFNGSGMNSGEWHRITVSGSISPVDVINFNTSVYALGASGTDTPTLIDDLNSVGTTSALSSDTEWHTFLKVRGDRGTTEVDNVTGTVVSPVPEPGSLGLVVLGIVSCFLGRRGKPSCA